MGGKNVCFPGKWICHKLYTLLCCPIVIEATVAMEKDGNLNEII